MMKSWKKLSRKTLLQHPRITIYEDDIELPAGQKTTYLLFEGPNAAQVIAKRDDGKILVQKEYSYPVNEWLFQFPGGAIEKDEPPEQGAARELAEEANIAGELKNIGWFYPDNRRKNAKFHVFVASSLHDVPETAAPKDTEEEFEEFWLSEEEIDKMIADGKITNYSILAGWALYKSTS